MFFSNTARSVCKGAVLHSRKLPSNVRFRCHLFYFFTYRFLENFTYLFLETREGREKEGEKHTRERTCNPGVRPDHGWNQRPLGLCADARTKIPLVTIVMASSVGIALEKLHVG